MADFWNPPFCLHAAGRGSAHDKSYYNDVSIGNGPQRLLLKHTLSGEGVLYVKDKRFTLHQGDLFMIERPGPYIYCFEENNEAWNFEYVSMVYNQSESILPKSLKENPVLSINEHDSLRLQLQDLIDLRMKEDYRMELHHSALAYQLFLSYIALRTELATEIPHGVKNIKQLITAGFASNLTINDYACRVGYTQAAITRLFKQHYKISPGQYLLHLRINKACRLLAENKLNIQEISQLCGFRSQNYFSRLFLKKINVTPSQYRSNPDVFDINRNILSLSF